MADETLRELWGKVDALMAKYGYMWNGNHWVKTQSSAPTARNVE